MSRATNVRRVGSEGQEPLPKLTNASRLGETKRAPVRGSRIPVVERPHASAIVVEPLAFDAAPCRGGLGVFGSLTAAHPAAVPPTHAISTTENVTARLVTSPYVRHRNRVRHLDGVSRDIRVGIRACSLVSPGWMSYAKP